MINPPARVDFFMYFFFPKQKKKYEKEMLFYVAVNFIHPFRLTCYKKDCPQAIRQKPLFAVAAETARFASFARIRAPRSERPPKPLFERPAGANLQSSCRKRDFRAAALSKRKEKRDSFGTFLSRRKEKYALVASKRKGRTQLFRAKENGVLFCVLQQKSTKRVCFSLSSVKPQW